MKRLAVRPYPLPTENLSGYLLRLGKLNGIFSLTEMLALSTGPDRCTQRASGWIQKHSTFAFLDGLDEHLGLHLPGVRSHFRAQYHMPWMMDARRSIMDIELNLPRICPKCVAEKGFIDWRWNLAVTGRCPEHHLPLIAECPKCGKPLRWEAHLLTGCESCCVPWEKMPVAPAGEVTSLEKRVWGCKDFSLEIPVEDEASKLLQDVCHAIRVLSRPFDSVHEPVRRVPNCRDHSKLVDLAYAVLDAKEPVLQWAAACRERRADLGYLGERVVLAPIYNLAKNLNKVPPHLSGWDFGPASSEGTQWSFPEHMAYAKGTTTRCLRSDNPEELRYLVDSEGAGLALKVRSEDVEVFVKGGILNPLHYTTHPNNRRFDVRDLEMLLPRLAREPDQSFTEVRSDSQRLLRYLALYGRLVMKIHKGEIEGGVPEGRRDLSSVYVREDQLQPWLEERLIANTQQQLPIYLVVDGLGCGEQFIELLVEKEALAWSKSSYRHRNILGRSYRDYILNRS